MLQLIKAERSAAKLRHLATVATFTLQFNSMDRSNYAQWLPIYLADMMQHPEKHPDVPYITFINRHHAMRRSSQPFAKVWMDMALEQSINRDSKTKGGIVGISQNPGALRHWFVTSHKRTAIARAVREMCDIED